MKKVSDLLLFHSGESTGFHNIVLFNVMNNDAAVLFSNRDDMKIADLYDELIQLEGMSLDQLNKPLFSWLNEVYMNIL